MVAPCLCGCGKPRKSKTARYSAECGRREQQIFINPRKLTPYDDTKYNRTGCGIRIAK